MSLRLLIVTSLLLVAGCAARPATQDDGMPPDFAGEISYRNGSVAPRYHYEWRVEFDARTARLAWTPGYADGETWREDVDLGADQRARLYDRLRETGLFEFTGGDDGLVGGPTGTARFGGFHDSGTLGTSEAGQDLLDEVVTVTKEIFPGQVWTAMERKQDEWSARQPK